MAGNTQKRKLDFTSDDIEEEEESTGYEKMPKMSFTCKNCKETFRVNSKEEMRVHYIEVHKKSPVDCDVCQKLFPSKRQLKGHKKGKHHFPCLSPDCTKICAKPADLENHMKSCHGDGNQFKCDSCPEFAFDTDKNLKKHIAEIHEAKAKIRQCHICQYKAAGEEDLVKHSEIHVPQKCKECGENFPTKGQLVKHKRKTGHDRFIKNKIEKKEKKKSKKLTKTKGMN